MEIPPVKSGSGQQPKLRSEDPEARRLASKRALWKAVSRVLIIAAVFAVIAVILNHNLGNVDSVDALGQRLRTLLHPAGSTSGKLKSYALFILGSTILVGVGLPRWMTAFAAGMIYGAMLGTGLAMVAALGGASVTYFIGSALLGSSVRNMLGKRFRTMKERFQRNAFGYTLHLRLFPISNATLTSLACGACRVPFEKYTAANIVGFVPQTIIFALFGSGAIKGSSSQFTIGIVLYLMLVLVHWSYRQRRKRRSLKTA